MHGAVESDGPGVLRGLAELAGGPQLLELGGSEPAAALVGGAVRDLLLGAPPRELDVVVQRDAALFAERLSALIGERAGDAPEVTAHERFGTAAVEWRGGRVDVAERRAESYPSPGALPEVRPGNVLEDLQRRDFTVNAISVTLAGPGAGRLSAVEHALEDLAARRLRVMHEESFIDDPTRLMRLARYAARLRFDAEPRTAELARRALGAGAVRTLSPARAGSELRLALAEAGAADSLARMQAMGLLAAIDPILAFEPSVAEDALKLLPADGRADVLMLSCLLPRSRAEAGRMLIALEALEVPAGERDEAIAAAAGAEDLARRLRDAARPSELLRAARASGPEAVALAGAAAGPDARGAAERWLGGLRDVRLSISGDDLLSAGVARGPEIGRRLDLALERRLDGEIGDGPEAELAAALEGP